MRLRRPGPALLVVMACVVVADQVAKVLVRRMVPTGEPVSLLGGLLYIDHIRNTGAAFGVMPGKRLLLIAFALLLGTVVALFWRKHRPDDAMIVLPLALVCGGAAGNLVDRALFGEVTDFIDVRFWPVFNVADSCISVGTVILLVYLLWPGGKASTPDDAPGGDAPAEDAR